jgi:hypothetical protein
MAALLRVFEKMGINRQAERSGDGRFRTPSTVRWMTMTMGNITVVA